MMLKNSNQVATKNHYYVVKILLVAGIVILLSFSITRYATSKDFHSPYFDISLDKNLILVSKTEEKDSFYRYVFASSDSEDPDLQMRVIVSDKKPEADQSLEDFQTALIGAMSAMFIDSYGLYQYAKTAENKKVLKEKPYTVKLGDTTFAGVTMYFGNIDASFLVTRSHNMTYAFMLISKNDDEQKRKNNLKMLTENLESIKFLPKEADE